MGVIYVTKQAEAVSDSDRQAGALSQDEIEVTPSMLEAAAAAVRDHYDASERELRGLTAPDALVILRAILGGRYFIREPDEL